MDAGKAKEIVDFVFKDIFSRDNPYSLEEIRKRYAFDMDIPDKVKDSVSGKDIWSIKRTGVSTMSMQSSAELRKKIEYPKPKKMEDLDDIFKFWKDSAYFIGDRHIDSLDIAESDSVFGSSSIYKSAKVHSCQKVVFSEDNSNCKQIVGCRFNNAATACIRVLDSAFVTSSFAVMWSKKVTKSMYVNNCYDLYECLFCSNVDTKKYCICNMQFTKEEYMPIKEMVIDWSIKNFGKGNTLGF